MSSVSLLNIGVSALNANQLSLGTAGHNVANANTPGYSRQRVDLASQEGAFTGGGFQGNGVRALDVGRVADAFLANQIRQDTASSLDVTTYLDGASQLDNLLANDASGLAPALASFFGALSAASADPTSVPTRRLAITQAQGLTTRLHSLYDRLSEQSTAANGQLAVSAQRVSTLARGIAQINEAVSRTGSSTATTQAPNDLLDKREELLRQLAEEVQVNTVTQSDGQLNVFIGNGQGLVVGSLVHTLAVNPATGGLVLRGDTTEQRIDSTLSGGRIGGLLRTRSGVSDIAFNSLGRIAQVLAQSVNDQHKQGVDLNGNAGGLLFTDINDPKVASERVTRLAGTGDADLRVTVDDAKQISTSDYELSFAGPSAREFQIKRNDDGVIVHRGSINSAFPVTVQFDHLSLTFDSGTYKAGDRFALRPTHFGARDFGTAITRPEELALASPLRTTAAIGNQGSGNVLGTEVLDIGRTAFASNGKLSPPLLVRFTSATTYDLLDATDPLVPKPLDPQLTGLPFIPGVSNKLLGDDPAQRIVVSDGARAGALVATATNVSSTDIAAGSQPGNGYLAESLVFVSTDPVTSQLTTVNLRTPNGSSAAVIANNINTVRGVTARASTDAIITGLQDNGIGTGMAVLVDGESFTGAALNNVGTLADAINASAALGGRGVTARSDGKELVISDAHGEDVRLLVKGDASDSLQLRDDKGGLLQLRGAGAGQPASITGAVNRAAGFDFRVGGPYTFGLSVDGRSAVPLTLNTNFADGFALVRGLQAQIDASPVGAGKVTVNIDSGGHITLQSAVAGAEKALAITDVAAGAPISQALGLANTRAQGQDNFQGTAVGGKVTVLLDGNVQFSAQPASVTGSLFRANPTARASFFGYQLRVSGAPAKGDQFLVGFNSKGSSDNSNALALTNLQTKPLLGGIATVADGYGELVQTIGSRTSEARIDAQSADGLVKQSTALRDSISGVNLDEEAANLVRFQQAYTASARIVSTARELFNTLLGIFN